MKNSIGDDGAAALAQALNHNSTLASLDLSWNSIGADGAVALAQALNHNGLLPFPWDWHVLKYYQEVLFKMKCLQMYKINMETTRNHLVCMWKVVDRRAKHVSS